MHVAACVPHWATAIYAPATHQETGRVRTSRGKARGWQVEREGPEKRCLLPRQKKRPRSPKPGRPSWRRFPWLVPPVPPPAARALRCLATRIGCDRRRRCRASASAPGSYWSSSWHCSRGTSDRSTAGWSSIHSRVEAMATPSQPAHQEQPRFHNHNRSSMAAHLSHGRIQSSCPSGRSTTSRARARCCASSLIWRRRGRSSSGARCPASMSSAAALATARATASASPSAVRPACGPPAARARLAGTAPRARCATPRHATLRTAAGC